MQAIYHVVNALKRNGKYYPAGSYFEADTEELHELVKAGVVVPVPGAKNTDQAAELVATREAEKAQLAEAEKATAPKNTWGPTPSEPEVPEEPTAQQEPEETEKTKEPEADEKQPETEPEDESGDNL